MNSLQDSRTTLEVMGCVIETTNSTIIMRRENCTRHNNCSGDVLLLFFSFGGVLTDVTHIRNERGI